MDPPIRFTGEGPFDEQEQALIRRVAEAVQRAGASELLVDVRWQVEQLDRFGALLRSYPSLFAAQSLGSRERDLGTLTESLCHSNPSNFDMFLPTRALLSRDLGMGEMNFYRLLRHVCEEALPAEQRAELEPPLDATLCQCLYTRLAEEVLKHIASDRNAERSVRERAALSLARLWEQATYRLGDLFPLLEATWEARRCVRVTAGTLMGSHEMFQLLQAGCDERFVDYLVRDDRSKNEEAAFREFLFGTTTESLKAVQRRMDETGKQLVCADDLPDRKRPAHVPLGGDPALAMFEFFLSRHLRAAARRQMDLPGPKRTAEEYVMLHYLRQLG